MMAALDVHYTETRAVTALVQFHHWADCRPAKITISTVPVPSEYVPGRFFRRELPCLMAALSREPSRFDTVIIDGYVHLKAPFNKGLGAHLAEKLPYPANVVGVAKSTFKWADRFIPVLRGQSGKALYVSSMGLPVETAAQLVARMHGAFRIPSLIKTADRFSRGIDEAVS